MSDTTQMPPAEPVKEKPPGLTRMVLMKLDRRTVNGFVVLAGLMGIAYVLMFHAPQTEVKDFLLMLLGVLAAMAKDVIGYDFGSSSGSEKKDDAMIANATKET